MSYNGWKNKETWLVNLWCGDIFTMDQEEGFEITPAYIEEIVYSYVYDLDPEGFIADLLNCALGEIDYREIAEHYKDREAGE